MRLLTFQEGPFLPPINGVLAHTDTYLQRLAAHGVDVTMVTNTRGNPDHALYRRRPWTTVFLPPRRYYGDVDLLGEIVRRVEPDVVHANEPEHIVRTVAAVAAAAGKPLAFETFDVVDTEKLRLAGDDTASFVDDAYATNPYLRRAATLAAGILCPSDQTGQQLAALGVPPEAITVAPTAFAPSRVRYGDRNLRARTISFVGNLYYLPNELAAHSLVDTVLPDLRRHFPRARLLVAGDGPEDLTRHLTQAGADYLGVVPDLDDLLAETTLLAAPLAAGRDLKTKIVLALNAGVPVITTRVGTSGMRRIGGVVVEDDIAAYAPLIAELFAQSERLRSLSEAGWSVAQADFAPDNQARVLAAFFRRVAAEPPRPALANPLDDGRPFRPVWLEEEYRRGRYREDDEEAGITWVVPDHPASPSAWATSSRGEEEPCA